MRKSVLTNVTNFNSLAWPGSRLRESRSMKPRLRLAVQGRCRGTALMVGERAVLAAVGGAVLQKPSGRKCLFNQGIDRKAEPHSSLVGLQEGWGRVWHANNARSLVRFGSASSTSIRTRSRHSSRPRLLPSLLICFQLIFISSIAGW